MINLFNHKVRIISATKLIQKGRYTLLLAELGYTRFDGKEASYKWVIFDRGNAVAVLLRRDDKFCIVEQLRPATMKEDGKLFVGSGGFLEIIAGTLNFGVDPVECIHRETAEEVGRRIKNVRLISDCFTSPGSSTEKIAHYLADDDGQADLPGGGLEKENEDIRIHWLTLEEIVAMIKSGEINDAKTILAVQAYMLENI